MNAWACRRAVESDLRGEAPVLFGFGDTVAGQSGLRMFAGLSRETSSQYHTATAPLALLKHQQRCPGCGFKYIVDALASETGTLEIFAGSNLLAGVFAFGLGHEAL